MDPITPEDPHTIPLSIGCVLIGPPGAGKTTLLASLQQCYLNGDHSFKKLRFSIREDEKLRAKFTDIAQQARTGLILPPTERFSVFKLQMLALRTENWATRFLVHRRSRSIELLDGKGSYLFEVMPSYPNDYQIFKKAVIGARNIIICVPYDRLGAPRDAAMIRLGELFGEITHEQTKNKLLLRRPLRQVIFCMTKFEKAFIEDGPRAHMNALNREFALARATRSLEGLDWLFKLVEQLNCWPFPPKVWVSLTSAFGFIRGSGEPNVETVTTNQGMVDKLLVRSDGVGYQSSMVYHYWVPFMTLDPLMQVITGRPGVLTFKLEELRV